MSWSLNWRRLARNNGNRSFTKSSVYTCGKKGQRFRRESFTSSSFPPTVADGKATYRITANEIKFGG